MTFGYRILVLGFSILAVACTKATPEFDLLDVNAIPQPKFNGTTVKQISTSSTSSTFLINGECDPKISAISGLAVGVNSSFSDLNSLATSAATVSCTSSGTFSFEMKSLTGLGFTPVQGQTYEVQLRGQTVAGQSNPSYIRITYTVGNGGPRILISGGGIHGGGSDAHAASGGTYKAVVRVNNYANNTGSLTSDAMSTKSGGSYIMKSGGATRY